MTPAVELSFLQDGAQSADQVAGQLASFIGVAKKSLDIAIYDLNLSGTPADQLREALRAASARGVAIRLLYNVDFPNPIPVPPPSQADPVYIESLGISHKPVSGIPDLMHHKYIVRDGGTGDATLGGGGVSARAP